MLSSFGFSPPQGPKFMSANRQSQYTSNSYIIQEEYNRRNEKRNSTKNRRKGDYSDNNNTVNNETNNTYSAISGRNNRMNKY